MVVVIHTGHSIRPILEYNENKVKAGLAECIDAQNYPIGLTDLNFQWKLNRLVKQVEMNPRVTRKGAHLSLNFDPSDVLKKEQLRSITADFMVKAGMGGQPYLVYRHDDAGHPHVHIVSIFVRADGQRIVLCLKQLERIRYSVEQAFGLKQCETSTTSARVKEDDRSPRQVQYGKSETLRSISNAVNYVIRHYIFCGLREMNALLFKYNLVADRGAFRSRIYQNRGLVYRCLDEAGRRVGKPVKASLVYNKPTLDFLEYRFQLNNESWLSHMTDTKNRIDLTLLRQSIQDMDAFAEALKRQGIRMVEADRQGGSQNLVYINDRSRCVYHETSLGAGYHAADIVDRCAMVEADRLKKALKLHDPGPRLPPSYPEEVGQPLPIYQQEEGTRISLWEAGTVRDREMEAFIPGLLQIKPKKQKALPVPQEMILKGVV